MVLKDLFYAPEGQKDPYTSAAVYLAHCYIMLGAWGVFAIGWDVWAATILVPVAYGLLWELPQFLIAEKQTKALAWDCVFDTTAVAFGCYAAALLKTSYMHQALWAWVASVFVAWIAYRVRE